MSDAEATGPLAELPDLSELPAARGDRLGDSALDHCLRRILAESDSVIDVVAGFNAAIEQLPADRTQP
jgi:hypothetical protein